MSISELVSKAKRKGLNEMKAFEAVANLSEVILLNQESALKAGLIHAEKRKKIKRILV
ncbi:MAG TPA: hypothetical protein VJK05_04015 [archaeon]|nr:hypothetical protein [archaeon]